MLMSQHPILLFWVAILGTSPPSRPMPRVARRSTPPYGQRRTIQYYAVFVKSLGTSESLRRLDTNGFPAGRQGRLTVWPLRLLPGSPRRLWLVSASLYGVCTVLPTWTVHEYPLFRRPTTAEKGCGQMFFQTPAPQKVQAEGTAWILARNPKRLAKRGKVPLVLRTLNTYQSNTKPRC